MTCRHFDISPQTLYRWLGRYSPRDLTTLEGRSRRPRRLRQPSWSAELERAVLELRRRYPRWGKDKLKVLLRNQGRTVSVSMVGRILKRLKRRGVLVESLRNSISARRPRPLRPYAVRKPKDYLPRAPGDLVSRWDLIEVHRRATAYSAAAFREALCARMPFTIRALQVDGGAEFQADCQRRRLKLFVLPPRSPKLNGAVQRAQRTHSEEFYAVHPFTEWTVDVLNREARLGAYLQHRPPSSGARLSDSA